MTELFARDHSAPVAQRTVARHLLSREPSKVTKCAMGTLPIVLAGTLAMGLTLIGPIDSAQAKPNNKLAGSPTALPKATAKVASIAPSAYRVARGDTVSGIATRYGITTAAVLALNGLGWKSLIFPGQVLRLSASTTPTPAPKPKPKPKTVTPAMPVTPVSANTYTIVRGDTISSVAARFGVSTQSLLTQNGLRWSSLIYPGQKIIISHRSAVTPPPPKIPATPPSSPVINIVPVVSITPTNNPTSTTPAPTPVTAPVPTPTPAPPPPSVTYVIHSGDTITAVAKRFGVSVQSILTANGLTMSSMIYSGRTLTIPGVIASPAGLGSPTAALTNEMATNAAIIISVGKSLGVSDYGLVIALAAAMQESSLRNLNYGDRDSQGLFQQRPSSGWGTPAQVTDPVYASKLFFGGPSNPNKGKTRGLLDIPGWQSMTVTAAAQAVQRSAYPNAYAKWEASARAWLAQLS